MVGTCPVPGDACAMALTFCLPMPLGTEYISRATVRLPGYCTQDPPYCPDFSNTISLPVLNP